jgi:hypothetical protein
MALVLAAVVAVAGVSAVAVVFTSDDGQSEPAASSVAPTRTTAAPTTAAGRAAGTTTTTTAAQSNRTAPVRIMEAYIAAIRARDCNTMVGMVAETSLSANPAAREAAIAACEQGFTDRSTGLGQATFGAVQLTSFAGDKAIVRFRQTIGGVTTTENVVVRRTDGRWWITFEQ